jgi:hypothetical protein
MEKPKEGKPVLVQTPPVEITPMAMELLQAESRISEALLRDPIPNLARIYPDQSHFEELQRILVKHAPEPVRGSTLAALIPRTDNPVSIYEEGVNFGGVAIYGPAASYITPVAAPHTCPDMPSEVMYQAASDVFGQEIQIPAQMPEVISSQLLVWWTHLYDEKFRPDILGLSMQQRRLRELFANQISGQIHTAARIITSALRIRGDSENPGQTSTAMPVLWGSWGFGDRSARSLSGRARGIPTMPSPHFHVTAFSPKDSPVLIDDLTLDEHLNQIKPWTRLLLQLFSTPIQQIFQDYARSFEETTATVTFDEAKQSFHIELKDSVRLNEVFIYTMGVVNSLNSNYEAAKWMHAHYWQNPSEKEVALQSLSHALRHVPYEEGASEEARDIAREKALVVSRQVAEFILRIRPTYSQLLEWTKETRRLTPQIRLLEKYEKAQYLLKSSRRSSLRRRLLESTLAEPDSRTHDIGVWPEHLGGLLVIGNGRDGYELGEEDIMVKEFDILLGIDSTQAGPEYIQKTIMRRPTGKSNS